MGRCIHSRKPFSAVVLKASQIISAWVLAVIMHFDRIRTMALWALSLAWRHEQWPFLRAGSKTT